jgi:hypothetical protein
MSARVACERTQWIGLGPLNRAREWNFGNTVSAHHPWSSLSADDCFPMAKQGIAQRTETAVQAYTTEMREFTRRDLVVIPSLMGTFPLDNQI